jgi:TrmH RNA methyltransferase
VDRAAGAKPAWKDATEGRSWSPRRGESEGGWRAEGEAPAARRPPRAPEQKVCGMNAALAAFAARPEALRKVYLSEARIGALRELLAFCVARRLGYRVVEDDELARISGSSHHEGVCLLLTPPPALDLEGLLARLPRSAPVRLLWLDGVGNPHNLGAVLRSAAHFGAAAVLLPPASTLGLSAAAARIAEGGAEHVPLVHLEGEGSQAEFAALDRLAEAGFVSVATLPAGADELYAHPLPARALFVLGAEGEGMQQRIVDHCARRLSIPGSGRVESLNIANAVAVLLAEHWRQHPSARG